MLLAGPVLTLAFNTWNFVDILSVSLNLPTIYFLVLVGVELPLCIVATLSWNVATFYFSGFKIVYVDTCLKLFIHILLQGQF